jgi:hypothetical protein
MPSMPSMKLNRLMNQSQPMAVSTRSSQSGTRPWSTGPSGSASSPSATAAPCATSRSPALSDRTSSMNETPAIRIAPEEKRRETGDLALAQARPQRPEAAPP